MWSQRILFAAAAALATGVLVAGAGLLGFWLGFRAPAREPAAGPERVLPAPLATAAPAPDEAAQISAPDKARITELTKARLEAAREVYKRMTEEYQALRGTPEIWWDWSPHMLEAELAAAATKAERVKAWEAHLERMREYEKVTKARCEAGRVSFREVAEVKFRRVDTELRLAQQKAAGPERVVPAPVAEAAPAPDEAPQISAADKARLEAAWEVYKEITKRYEAEITRAYEAREAGPDSGWDWSPYLLEAELAVAATKAERVKAWQAHLGRVREYEKATKARFEAGRAGYLEVAQAKFRRLDVELRLAQEKAR